VTRNWSDVTDGARRRVAGSKWGQPRLWFEFALGATLVVGGAIGAAVWQRQATRPLPVLVAARDLQRGDTVTAGDLAVATLVGADGVRVTPPSDSGRLVGAALMVDVAAATPMTAQMVETRRRPEAGEALVSVALGPGEVPPDLAALDPVRIVTVRFDPLGSAPPAVFSDRGAVWAVRPPGDLDTITVVTLRVPGEVLERVTLADRVRIGVVAP